MINGEVIQQVHTRSQMDEDSEEEEIKISQFFTRNKSLSFLLSNDRAHKPHKKMGNISLVVRREGETESVDDPKSHMPRTGKSKTKNSINQSLPIEKIKENERNKGEISMNK